MPRQKMLAALFALAVPVLAMSCDSGSDPFTEADFPLCAPHTLRLVGSIDDLSIDVTLIDGAGGGFSQGDDGGDFQYHASYPGDPMLELAWERGVTTGKVTSATGTLRMIDGPFANRALCIGDGTTIRLPGDDTVIQFELAGIRSGEGCTVAHTGQLRGCMR